MTSAGAMPMMVRWLPQPYRRDRRRREEQPAVPRRPPAEQERDSRDRHDRGKAVDLREEGATPEVCTGRETERRERGGPARAPNLPADQKRHRSRDRGHHR